MPLAIVDGRPHAADRHPRHGLPARLIEVVGAEIACPH
jgi:hypothetical protein